MPKADPTPASEPKLKPGFVTLAEAASRVNLDRRTLSRYRREGMAGLQYPEKEGVNWHEFHGAYLDRRMADAAKGQDDDELKLAKRRQTISTANKAQASWQMMEGSTGRIEDMHSLMQGTLNEIVTSLRQWPRVGAPHISAWFGTQLQGVIDDYPELARHLVFDLGALERFLQAEMNDLIGTTADEMADTALTEVIKRAKAIAGKGQ